MVVIHRMMLSSVEPCVVQRREQRYKDCPGQRKSFAGRLSVVPSPEEARNFPPTKEWMWNLTEESSYEEFTMEQTKSFHTQRDAAIVTLSNKLSAKTKHCKGCGTEIPEARLQARPNATHCVSCLTELGDVPLLCDATRTAYVTFNDIRPKGDGTNGISPENTSIKTLSLPGAIRAQEAILARESAARVRGY